MAARERPPAAAPGLARRLLRASSGLAREERLAGLAALALWASMFLPWYSKHVTEAVKGSLSATSYNLSAFGAFSFVEAAVLLVAGCVIVLLFARAERRAFHLPGGDGTVILAGGIWTTVLIFYRMLDKTEANAQATTTTGVQWGIFLALAAALGLAYAGTRLRAAHRPEPTAVEDPTFHPRAGSWSGGLEPDRAPRRSGRGARRTDGDPPTPQSGGRRPGRTDDTPATPRRGSRGPDGEPSAPASESRASADTESTERLFALDDLAEPPELREVPRRRRSPKLSEPDPFGEHER